MIKVVEVTAASALNRSGLSELDYTLNPYLGCLHACRYCFAVDITPHREAREMWGSTVAVRVNILDVLKKEIHRLRRGVVGVSTITDPYQAVEGRYRITRSCTEMLLRNGFRVSVQTKSPLVRRDVEIFSQYRSECDVGITITTLSKEKSRIIEPGAPSPESRVAALEDLSRNGISTWIFYGPIVSGFNDDSDTISGLLDVARSTGSRIIYDRFSGYPSAVRMMRKSGFPESSISPGEPWWNSTASIIKQASISAGVKATAQDEEFLDLSISHQSTLRQFGEKDKT